MTRKEAKLLIGERLLGAPGVEWSEMDERIAKDSIVLERIGANKIGVLTYRLTHETDRLWLNKRYTTCRKIAELRQQEKEGTP